MDKDAEQQKETMVEDEEHPHVSFRHRPSIIDNLVVSTVRKPTASGGAGGAAAAAGGAEDTRPLKSEADAELAVFVEEDGDGPTGPLPTLNAYLRTFTSPMRNEKEESSDQQKKAPKKAKLGVILGVYLPTIQHIFGVLMFLRLFWIVGVSGVWESGAIVFICCFCTLLTSISMSAIATNGVVESGGVYFMISRNLGPEFGSAVGVLFYLANAMATSMYLVGGVEMLLVYLLPTLPKFGEADEFGHIAEADMFNNFRIYASILLLIEFVIVAIGVRFVQLFAPISLSCVIVSVLAMYAGAFAASPDRGPKVCLLGDVLLRQHALYENNTYLGCNKTALERLYCAYTNSSENEAGFYRCEESYMRNDFREVPAFPGFLSGVFKENMQSQYTKKGEAAPGVVGNKQRDVVQDIATGFFILLAIYFPSVTGIMTGSNMSGDLADPQKSIPVGTIAAQFTTSFVYLSLIFAFGGTVNGAVLRDKFGYSLNTLVTAKLAWPSHWILLIGSFTSTFGAALQCLCSAPRLLQSIAKDEVLPFLRPFATLNRFGEPFYALLITTVIAECGILVGAIDHIAPIVDFFFLMCYGFVNLVCALQTLVRAPNWRPRFRYYHWSLSLLGAALCAFIMFATYWYYALVVCGLCAAIYKYVEYAGARKEWGDGIRGLALSTARYSLLRIEEAGEQHCKNWRPQLLALVKTAPLGEEAPVEGKCQQIVGLAGQLKAGKGLLMAATLLEGDVSDPVSRSAARQSREQLKSCMDREKAKGFSQAVICTNRSEGLSVLIQSLGIGALRPNTVVVGWPTQWKAESPESEYYDFLDAIQKVTSSGMCLLIPKGDDFPLNSGPKQSGNIDVWWVMHDGGLLLLLPFLLLQHRVWRHCRIRVFSVAGPTDNTLKMREDLRRMIYQLRITAEVSVVELGDSDLTAYTHQKTLQMEKRTALMQKLRLSQKALSSQPQLLLDALRRGSNQAETSLLGGDAGSGPDEAIEMTEAAPKRSTAAADTAAAAAAAAAASGDGAKEPLISNCQYTFSAAAARAAFRLPPSGGAEEDDTEVAAAAAVAAAADEAVNAAAAAAANAEQADGLGDLTGDLAGDRSGTKKKMHSAIRLNRKISELSGDSKLVIINLPKPPRNRDGLNNYICYLDALTEGLNRVLLVRGTGKEVITIYS
ncbi:hypothetical protein BOX15_Mlig002002g2 [Macrostomum lignano]|uniref:Uncharacterized protein n=1 Tax=Macrostomum lignano TaxID=282301 RepID=A0A267F799_9PLAT|nr:hypothetical protein BOX15_Mlig002002g2 [Macrostomum lignano]